VGIGAQDDFEFAQQFLKDTGIGRDITMLYEQSGQLWSINNVFSNSSLQLMTHDLTQESQLIWFNDDGRSVVLDAAVQEPWAPADSPNLK